MEKHFDAKKVAQVLTERIGRIQCPMCQKKNFHLTEGFINVPIQKDLNAFRLGGPSLPLVILTCTNCGFTSQHNAMVLGLIPKDPVVSKDIQKNE